MERSIANAASFACWVTMQPNLELVAPVHLNVVCFRVRHRPDGDGSDGLNEMVVESIQAAGMGYVTATRWGGSTAIRAAFDNWATTAEDVRVLQDAVTNAARAVQLDTKDPGTGSFGAS